MNYLDEGNEIVIAILTSRTFQACEESNGLFQLFDESVNISVAMLRQMLDIALKIKMKWTAVIFWCGVVYLLFRVVDVQACSRRMRDVKGCVKGLATMMPCPDGYTFHIQEGT